MLDLQLANRDFFAPFEPERPPNFFTLEGQREWLAAPAHVRWLILDDDDPAGFVGISSIVRGDWFTQRSSMSMVMKRCSNGACSGGLRRA